MKRHPAITLLIAATLPGPATADTITIKPQVSGTSPEVLGYNLAHFMPGSNAADWWRYSGLKAARVFLSPGNIEATDDLAPFGDGVTSMEQFMARRAALRADPMTTEISPASVAPHLRKPYIGWAYLENRYADPIVGGTNRFKVNHAFGELRSQGVDLLLQITGSMPVASAEDWPGLWELWQHYYFQSYYLGRNFDVERYSMYNEPNHSAAGGLTPEDWRLKLRYASDAIQCGIADVNRDHGKHLVARIHAPTTASAIGTAWDNWGRPAVENRHQRFDLSSDPGWRNFQHYSYQSYSITPSTLASQASELRTKISALTPGEPIIPLAITEFNTRTGASFDDTTATPDRPDHFSALGAGAIALVKSSVRSLYLFKFGMTAAQSADANYPVQKNGLHYVNNDTGSSLNNYGGITRSGEVWRLFNRMAIGRRDLLTFTKGNALNDIEVMVSKDAVNRIYQVFMVNRSTSPAIVDLDVSALGLPQDNRVTVSEVSDRCYGAVQHFTRINSGKITVPGSTMPAQSVWLISIPMREQAIQENSSPVLLVDALADVNLRDGNFRNTADGSDTMLHVKNGTTSADDRRAAIIRFDLSHLDLSELETAILTVDAASTVNGTTAQAHVYGLASDSWDENSVTWAAKTQLKQNHAAGLRIEHNVVQANASSIRLQGQLVASSSAPSEKHIDVTSFIKSQAAGSFSFLISQDAKWDTDILDKAPAAVVIGSGNVQSAGIDIRARESGSAPRLQIVRRVAGSSSHTPVEAWRIANFGSASNSGNAADSLDADADGATNLLEYALCGNPLAKDSGDFLPWISLGLDHAELRFRRDPLHSDLRLLVQLADRPSGPWTDGAVSETGGVFVSTQEGLTVTEAPEDSRMAVVIREGRRHSRYMRIKAELLALE